MYKCACILLIVCSGWSQNRYPGEDQTTNSPVPKEYEDLLTTPRMKDESRHVFVPSPDIDSRSRPPGESISVAELQHKTPGKAKDAFLRAEKLVRAGRHDEAVAQLEAATRYDPKFAAAFAASGIEYALLGRLSEAQTSLTRAIELDPDSWQAFYNLGLVSFQLGDLAAAERNVRHALELSKTDPTLHLFLACLLSLNDKTGAEAIAHVQYAARRIRATKPVLAIPVEPRPQAKE